MEAEAPNALEIQPLIASDLCLPHFPEGPGAIAAHDVADGIEVGERGCPARPPKICQVLWHSHDPSWRQKEIVVEALHILEGGLRPSRLLEKSLTRHAHHRAAAPTAAVAPPCEWWQWAHPASGTPGSRDTAAPRRADAPRPSASGQGSP